jgi:hypothetical protein
VVVQSDLKTAAPGKRLVVPEPEYFTAEGAEFTESGVFSSECIPGPGSGDFQNKHLSGDAAIADILDFFFGSPERMNRVW